MRRARRGRSTTSRMRARKRSGRGVQNRDAEKTYNKYDLAALTKLTPALNWNAFFAGAGVPVAKSPAVIVTQPSYFEVLGKLIDTVPVASWREYFRYKLVNSAAPELPAKFVQLNFEFAGRTVSGIEEIKLRWKRGVDIVENSIGDLAGKMYIECYFSVVAKECAQVLVGNILAAYAQGIDQLPWMTPATRQKAHDK